MPNYCDYRMHVKGKKCDLEEFHTVMTDYNHNPHFWRVFEAEMLPFYEGKDDVVVAEISGYCAWSVYCCMCDGLHTYANRNPENSSSLQKESKRLNLEIEVWSQEPGMGFQEYYHYRAGKEIASEAEDCDFYWFDESEYDGESSNKKFECFLEQYGLSKTYKISDLNENDEIIIGGFTNFGRFSF